MHIVRGQNTGGGVAGSEENNPKNLGMRFTYLLRWRIFT